MSKFSTSLSSANRLNVFSKFVTGTAVVSAAFVPHLAAAQDSVILPTVSVIENDSSGSYNAPESSFYKLNVPLVDSPRTVTTVTRQLMDDQGVTTVSNALRNVPGVSLAAGEGGNQGDNISIRGFSARSDIFIDGMRDFGSYFRDSFNLDSVDVLQGPSSSLFGRGSTGGSVVQNSKQAFLGSKIEGTTQFGTNDTKRATIDVNQQIPGLKGAAIRINAMTHSNDVAERNDAAFRRNAIAPTIAFGLGTDTRLNINYLHQDENNTPDYGVPFYKGEPADVNRKNFYGYKNDYFKTNVDISTVKFEHDLSKDVTFRNQSRYARYFRNTEISNPSTTNGSTVSRSMIIRQSLDTYLGNQSDLISKFSTFGVEHSLDVGLALESESATPNNFTASGGTTSLSNPAVAYFSATPTFNGVTSTKINTTGVYALDTLKFNKQWELSLGGRFDNIQTNYNNVSSAGLQTTLSQTNNVFSYNGGLIYKPQDNGSIYISGGTSFNPSSESLSLSTTTYNLDPEQTTSYELGTKWDLFHKKLSVSTAIYQVEKDNVRETVNGESVLSGTQRVRGFFAQISGQITKKWNIMMGYNYMDGQVTKSLADANQVGRPLANTPENSFNLFTTYKLDPKFEIGGGANYIGKRYVSPVTSSSTPDPVTGTVRNVPSYITLNAMAKYSLNKNIDFQLNINNLTNEYYFDQLRGSNAAIPGEGRVVLLTTKVKF